MFYKVQGKFIGGRIVFNNCWNNWVFICKKILRSHLHPHFTTYTKISSKLIIDLNIKPKNCITSKIHRKHFVTLS